jgi:hypothetical protein
MNLPNPTVTGSQIFFVETGMLFAAIVSVGLLGWALLTSNRPRTAVQPPAAPAVPAMPELVRQESVPVRRKRGGRTAAVAAIAALIGFAWFENSHQKAVPAAHPAAPKAPAPVHHPVTVPKPAPPGNHTLVPPGVTHVVHALPGGGWTIALAFFVVAVVGSLLHRRITSRSA